MRRFIRVEFEDGVSQADYEKFGEAVQELAAGMVAPDRDNDEIWVTGGGSVAPGVEVKQPGQPPMGGFCDGCGHFAYRHNEDGCTWPEASCACTAMLWNGHRWPRPWLAAPEGLVPE